MIADLIMAAARVRAADRLVGRAANAAIMLAVAVLTGCTDTDAPPCSALIVIGTVTFSCPRPPPPAPHP